MEQLKHLPDSSSTYTEETSSRPEEQKTSKSERYSGQFYSEQSYQEVTRQLEAVKINKKQPIFPELNIESDSSNSEDQYISDQEPDSDALQPKQSSKARTSSEANNIRNWMSVGSSGQDFVSSMHSDSRSKQDERYTEDEDFKSSEQQYSEQYSQPQTEQVSSEARTGQVVSSKTQTYKNSISSPKTVQQQSEPNSVSAASIVESVKQSSSFKAKSDFADEIQSESIGEPMEEEYISDSIGTQKTEHISEPLSEEEISLDVEIQDVALKKPSDRELQKPSELDVQEQIVSQQSSKIKSDISRKKSGRDMFCPEVEAIEINSNTDMKNIVRNQQKISKRQENKMRISSANLIRDSKKEEPLFGSPAIEASSGQVPESFDSDSSEGGHVVPKQPKVKQKLEVQRTIIVEPKKPRQRYAIENSVSIGIQPSSISRKTSIEQETIDRQEANNAYGEVDETAKEVTAKRPLPNRILQHPRAKIRTRRADNLRPERRAETMIKERRLSTKAKQKSSDKSLTVNLKGTNSNLARQPTAEYTIKPILQERAPMTSQSTNVRIGFDSARHSYANIVPVNGLPTSSNFYIRGGKIQPRNQNFMQLSGTTENKSISNVQIKMKRQQSENKRLHSHLNSFSRKTSANQSIKRPIPRITSAMPKMKTTTVEKCGSQDQFTKDSSQGFISIEPSQNNKNTAFQPSIGIESSQNFHKKRFQQNRKYLKSAGVNRPLPHGVRNENHMSYAMSDFQKPINSMHRNLQKTATSASIRKSQQTPSAYTQIPSPIKEKGRQKIVAAGPRGSSTLKIGGTASSIQSISEMDTIPRAQSTQSHARKLSKRSHSQLTRKINQNTRNEQAVKDLCMKDFMGQYGDNLLGSSQKSIPNDYFINKNIEAQSRFERSECTKTETTKYPKLNFKEDELQPIQKLDNLIQKEEERRGGPSVYNRGNKLKLSLIDPQKVKVFLAHNVHQKAIQMQQEQQEQQQIQVQNDQFEYPGPRIQNNMNFLGDQHLHEEKKWKLMMNHFKHNPDDLLELFPTPKQSFELNGADQEFNCKMSPQAKFKLLQDTHRQREKQLKKESLRSRSVTPSRTPRYEKDKRMMLEMEKAHMRRSQSPEPQESPMRHPNFIVNDVSKKSLHTNNSSALKSQGIVIGDGNFGLKRSTPQKCRKTFADRNQSTQSQHVAFETEYGRQLAVVPVKKKSKNSPSKKKENVSASDANSQRLNSKEKKSSISKKRGSKGDNKNENQTLGQLKQQRQEQIYIAQKLRKMEEESRRKNQRLKKDQGNILQAILMEPINPDSKYAKKLMRNRAILREARIAAGVRDIDVQIQTEPEKHMIMIEGVDFKNTQVWQSIMDNNCDDQDLHGMMEIAGSKKRSKQRHTKEDRSQMMEEEEIQTILNRIKLARTGKPQSLKSEVIDSFNFIVTRATNSIKNILQKLLTNEYAEIEAKNMQKDDKKYFSNFEHDVATLNRMERVLTRLQRLYHFYEITYEFFHLIFEREVTFKQLRKQAKKIDSDVFFRIEEQDVNTAAINYEEKIATKHKGSARGYQLEDGPMLHRVLMRKYGNKLIDDTEKCLSMLHPFKNHLNGELNHLHLKEFIFGNADFVQVVTKEVYEVRQIFQAYDMKLSDLGPTIQAQISSLSNTASVSTIGQDSARNSKKKKKEAKEGSHDEPAIITVNDQQHRQFSNEPPVWDSHIQEIVSIPLQQTQINND